MKTITTPKGPVQLLPPPTALISELGSLLPFGIECFDTPQSGADYGIVMQCGEEELFAVKQQPVDLDEKSAFTAYQANVILITHALKTYAENGFGGLLLPCAYMRPKDGGKIESGIAIFAYPSKTGKELLPEEYSNAFDNQLGRGFTSMMIAFTNALKQSSQITGIAREPVIGMDVRRRLQLGRLGFGFAILGTQLICLKTGIHEADPVWIVLRSVGVDRVFHLPSIPLAIKPEYLTKTKLQQN